MNKMVENQTDFHKVIFLSILNYTGFCKGDESSDDFNENRSLFTQPAITSSKLTTETLEQDVKYVQS